MKQLKIVLRNPKNGCYTINVCPGRLRARWKGVYRGKNSLFLSILFLLNYHMNRKYWMPAVMARPWANMRYFSCFCLSPLLAIVAYKFFKLLTLQYTRLHSENRLIYILDVETILHYIPSSDVTLQFHIDNVVTKMIA